MLLDSTVIQCALRGGSGGADPPGVPGPLGTPLGVAGACHSAGAGSVPLPPRRPNDGAETLAAEPHGAVVSAIRGAVPDLEISCSTAEGIDLGGAADRISAVRAWTSPPDLVSLNVAEAGAGELGKALLRGGIGIEAGVF